MGVSYNGPMAHTIQNKEKLIARIKRIRGQVAAIERALEEEQDCSSTLNTVAACRGALNGLMAELIEGHIVSHLESGHKPAERKRAATDLIDVIRSYLK